ncbi:MAG: helix-hairpin-helix domain-containing protein [Gammaproteobacteria bacterium]|nr:helix-hairpin-helix domain-containing protein [Gammaproteobacteria bacterium]
MFATLAGVAAAQEMTPKVNLNTANADALQYIPGIGPGKSADIIRFRQETGGFKAMEDLLAIPGIGEKTLIDIAKFGSLDSGVSELTEEMAANPPTRASSGEDSGTATGG